MPNDSSRDIEARTLRLLWASIALGVGVFAGLTAVLPPPLAEGDPTLFFVFAAVALGNGMLSFVVPKIVYRNGLQREKIPIDEVPDPNAPAGFGSVRRVRIFRNPEAARRLARQHFRQTFIIGLALAESVAVFGFVANRLGHPQLFTLPFFLVSGVLIAVKFPSGDAPEKWFEATLGATFPP
jgi:hypothetical protein